jgi:TetR/AcrR family transcriptional regulator
LVNIVEAKRAVRKTARAKGDRRAAIVRAATDEFAARGFAAAGVDRIARRARVNKALIYYYFGSKLALYREVIALAISMLASRLEKVASADDTAENKIRRWVEALSAFLSDFPVVAPLMLRELADGGKHFDPPTLRRITTIVPMVVRIVDQGRAEGVFGDADPLALHFMLLGSTILFTANAPIRRRVRQLGLAQPPLGVAPFVRHLQQVALRTLRKDAHHDDSID